MSSAAVTAWPHARRSWREALLARTPRRRPFTNRIFVDVRAFLCRAEGRADRSCLPVTSELAEFLEDVELTPESVSRTRKFVGLHCSIYIDVPTTVIPIGTAADL